MLGIYKQQKLHQSLVYYSFFFFMSLYLICACEINKNYYFYIQLVFFDIIYI